ncbi:hypothetical protein OG777_14090 [Micromonospora peucetia]|uniref:Uncharacterized protein n=1 Tax=Micromonospora peucetia TaxID=47871 RepID=A0ABZ1E8W1_9ACTN|nr:hypothetical protein [Micromonospora peucetia]MCX4388060.1 hypothetical protein [Micromonospora peucetia]WSA31252.1 hypothetical protein OIE14_24400 [Micromonospora peucetia]
MRIHVLAEYRQGKREVAAPGPPVMASMRIQVSCHHTESGASRQRRRRLKALDAAGVSLH